MFESPIIPTFSIVPVLSRLEISKEVIELLICPCTLAFLSLSTGLFVVRN
jgi:hypothetical protein